MMNMMLELAGITKRYGATVAVDRLNLGIAEGEFFALLGPNAAGKTTTVKMIAGLLSPDSGCIRIAGRDSRREAHESRAVVGYVPDIPYLYDKLSVAETLDFVTGVHGMPEGERAAARDQVIARFGLSNVRDALAEQLSHGMRQRLVFAMAMVHRPRLMVVDEPFVGLDPHSARTVKDSMKECARRGGAVLMSTHTLSAAEELADRIGILLGGRIIAMGTPAELLRKAGGAEGLEAAFLRITGGDPAP